MNRSLDETRVSFASGELTLQGALHDGERELSALVLHPHPLYGGDMQNHVVAALCSTLAAAGATTLRFDFRGAGASEGTFDNGHGELEDAAAAAAFLRSTGERPLMLAGYSFGAVIAAAAAETIGPAAVILVSPPPMGPTPGSAFVGPLLAVTGDQDPIAPPRVLEGIAANGTRTVVAGVDHGWWPGLAELDKAVEAFIDATFPRS